MVARNSIELSQQIPLVDVTDSGSPTRGLRAELDTTGVDLISANEKITTYENELTEIREELLNTKPSCCEWGMTCL